MTTKQVIKQMQARFPRTSIFVTVNDRAYSHIKGISREYEVYSGTSDAAIAKGVGATLDEAFNNVAVIPQDMAA